MNTYSEEKIYESYSNEVERMQKYIDELLQENKRLEMIIKEYERLNKKNGRGFKITNVQEYNIDELLSYKKYKDKLENQQKEFIEYLEDLIKQNETVVEVSKYGLPKNCSKLLIDFYKEILSKYKEIIGDVKNENK